MKLQDIKALRAYSETFWKSGDNPASKASKKHKRVPKGLIIENDISGSWETDTTNLGQRVNRFKAYTDNAIWSHWRVGIPVKYKGKRMVLWVRAYHCDQGEPIIWMRETIWMIDTDKEMRKSVQDNCWDYMMDKSRLMAADVSGVTMTKFSNHQKVIDGWMCDHNNIKWTMYPSDKGDQSYWLWHHDSDTLVKWCKTLKEAKIFIKDKGATWVASRLFAG